MRFFTHTELMQLAREAGLPEDKLDLAAAVAKAESGGGEARGHPTLDPNVRKDTNSRWSIGLWQINSLVGPPPGAGRGRFSNDDLAVAKNNAAAMAEISAMGSNFKPWGAFTNGSFKQFVTGSGLRGPVTPPVDLPLDDADKAFIRQTVLDIVRNEGISGAADPSIGANKAILDRIAALTAKLDV